METKRPDLKPGDVHVIVNDFEQADRYIGEAKCYSADDGKLLWEIPALGKGVEGYGRSDVHSGDTPPGLYLAGRIWETTDADSWQDWHSYGPWCVDMEEQESQEERVGRAGICWHGGGSGAPDPLADYQLLVPTLGCVRSHNRDMATIVIPMLKTLQAQGNRMWITVNQFG